MSKHDDLYHPSFLGYGRRADCRNSYVAEGVKEIVSMGLFSTFENLQKSYNRIIQTLKDDVGEKTDVIDVNIQNAFILAAGRTGNFLAAENVYRKLLNENRADKDTYTAFILAAGKTGNFADGRVTYNYAKSIGKSDENTDDAMYKVRMY